ncbi:hypothetical protein ACFP1L_12015 [Lactiplantibacillus nangangensis]|uniref:Uncharacterized protein n=1 Tax=Lactiplantibacillus nangangensis TaxID=2559917 RepID=A0ABW1SMI7_9LACO|nr:hypothetical protein [Lactiplantibacillus nangangensis]
MSFVNAVISPRFISIASDGQVSNSDGTREGGHTKYFKFKAVPGNTIYIGATGNVSVVEFVKKELAVVDYSVSIESLLNYFRDFFKKNSSLLMEKDAKTNFMIVGTNHKIVYGYTFFLDDSGRLQENDYPSAKPNDLIVLSAIPPEFNDDPADLFLGFLNGKNIHTKSDVIGSQRKLFKYVASRCESVNNEFFQHTINL